MRYRLIPVAVSLMTGTGAASRANHYGRSERSSRGNRFAPTMDNDYDDVRAMPGNMELSW